jgi:hypothetical protein
MAINSNIFTLDAYIRSRMGFVAQGLYDSADFDQAFSVDYSLRYPVAVYPSYTFYQEGTIHDIHVWYRNDGNRILSHVTIEPVARVAAAAGQVTWWKFATTQAGLPAAVAGGLYRIGDSFAPGESQDFWIRVTVPASQAEGSNTGIALRISGYYRASIFSMDAIISA